MDIVVVMTGAALLTGLITFAGTGALTGALIMGGMATADRKAKNVGERTLNREKANVRPLPKTKFRAKSGGARLCIAKDVYHDRQSEGNRHIRDEQL